MLSTTACPYLVADETLRQATTYGSLRNDICYRDEDVSPK